MFEVSLQIRAFRAPEFLKHLPHLCPLKQSKIFYKKQLVDGANDLYAWNIEDVWTHLNNVKCQSKLKLLKIYYLDIFIATNSSLHKRLKVVSITLIILFGYNSTLSASCQFQVNLLVNIKEVYWGVVEFSNCTLTITMNLIYQREKSLCMLWLYNASIKVLNE